MLSSKALKNQVPFCKATFFKWNHNTICHGWWHQWGKPPCECDGELGHTEATRAQLKDEKVREREEKAKIKEVERLRPLIEELTSEKNHNWDMRLVIEELKADKDQKLEIVEDCLEFLVTVPCKARGRGFFSRADSFVYISRQGMTSLDLCLQLIPPGQGNQPRRQQPALAGLASPCYHRREAGGHLR